VLIRSFAVLVNNIFTYLSAEYGFLVKIEKKSFLQISDISREVDETIHLYRNDEKAIFMICEEAVSVLKEFKVATLNIRVRLYLTDPTTNFVNTSCLK
jgi:hypothetical protein